MVPYSAGGEQPGNRVAESTRYFFATPNGSVHQVVAWDPLAGGGAGATTLTDTELTSAWGVPILKAEIPGLLNPGAPVVPTWSSDFGYTGRRKLGNSGLMDYRNRIYDPALGRFLTSDPIGTEGGLNTYAYVSGDPVNFGDPWGLNPESDFDTGINTLEYLLTGKISGKRRYAQHMYEPGPACEGPVVGPAEGQRTADAAPKLTLAGRMLTDAPVTVIHAGKAAKAEWQYGNKAVAAVYVVGAAFIVADGLLTGFIPKSQVAEKVAKEAVDGVKLAVRGGADELAEEAVSAAAPELRRWIAKALAKRVDELDELGECGLTAARTAHELLRIQHGTLPALSKEGLKNLGRALGAARKQIAESGALSTDVVVDVIRALGLNAKQVPRFVGTFDDMLRAMEKLPPGVYVVAGDNLAKYGHAFTVAVTKRGLAVIDATMKNTRTGVPVGDVMWDVLQVLK